MPSIQSQEINLLRTKKVGIELARQRDLNPHRIQEIHKSTGISIPYLYQLASEKRKNAAESKLKALERELGIASASSLGEKSFLEVGNMDTLKGRIILIMKQANALATAVTDLLGDLDKVESGAESLQESKQDRGG